MPFGFIILPNYDNRKSLNLLKGSTSCLKRHLRSCPHVGKGTHELFADLEMDFSMDELMQFINMDDSKS